MSFATNLSNLTTRIATEFKALRTLINGNASDLTGLNTTVKTDLVSAINEVNDSVASASGIDDATTSSTSSWSSSKTSTEIAAAAAALVDTAPGTLDTLNELAAALGDDPNFATTITASISTKATDTAVVHLAGAETVTGVKTFSAAPVVPASSFTIAATSGLQSALDGKVDDADLGDPATNFVTVFEAGLV